MNGLLIQLLLGLYFTVEGLAQVVDGGRGGSIVILCAGILLLLLVFVKKSLFGL